MEFVTGNDIRKALGNQSRTEIAPDMAPGTTPAAGPQERRQPAPRGLPSITMFTALMDKIEQAPNDVLTPAVAENPALLNIVRPYMSGKVGLDAIAPALAQAIVQAAGGGDPDMAVGEWLQRFAGGTAEGAQR